MARPAKFGRSAKKRSSAQEESLRKGNALRHADKENQPPHRSSKATHSRETLQTPSIVTKPTSNFRTQYDTKRKALTREKKKNQKLKNVLNETETTYNKSMQKYKLHIAHLEARNIVLLRMNQELETELKAAVGENQQYKTMLRSLKKALKRLTNSLKIYKNQSKLSKAKTHSRITSKGAYTLQARDLARRLFMAGCSPEKIGTLIQHVAASFGVTIDQTMSARTVRRCVLESLVSSDVQLAYEMSMAQGFTISQDSTSNRHVNYQAHHIAMPVPTYENGEVQLNPAAQHAVRLLRVASTLDHSSKESAESWKTLLKDVENTYHSSPLAERSPHPSFTIRHIAEKLMGMNTDHATGEKGTADLMKNWKKDTIVDGLGGDVLSKWDIDQLKKFLNAKKALLIEKLGGHCVWNSFDELTQSVHEAGLMQSIKIELGTTVYEGLPSDRRRILDLFIWGGCCMHKDLNSFKGGTDAVGKFWEEQKLQPPILLANKYNAAKIREALDPSKCGQPLTDEESAAIEASTRGGVKTTALAGALFNNKDDKKGYGDSHIYHLMNAYGLKHTHRFPDTSNVRFNSYAEAAGELLKRLEFYRKFLEAIKWGKSRPGWTNIELNLYNALHDQPTLTELAVMVLYSLSVTHPYLRLVRGPGTEQTNLLDLGPLHSQVRDHCRAVIDNPDLLIHHNADCSTATLDGKEWEDWEALSAVRSLQVSGEIPHLQVALVAFFKGALVTWVRFSAEFAPGGIIDELNTAERKLAWMPSTNDTNEGALGSYRVYMRSKPSTTLLNYNAHAVIQKNNTLAFMDAVFTEEDHEYIREVARKWDSEGRERKRHEAQAAFESRCAEMKREKVEEARRKEESRRNRLLQLKIVSVEDVGRLKVDAIDEQLDALREIFNDDSIPKGHGKKARGLKDRKVILLKEALAQYYSQGHSSYTPIMQQDDEILVDCWAQDGDELEQEMEMDN